jgi:hypothetical protein
VKIKDSELNDSKHSLNLICSEFLHECNFYAIVAPTFLNFVTFSKSKPNQWR